MKHQNINRLVGLLFAFSVFPIIILLIGELLKFIEIGPLRITDYIEILLYGPGMIYLGYKLFNDIQKETPAQNYFIVLLTIIGLFYISGISMHWVANSLNVYITETHNYINIIPNDLYSIIYFIDEVLSHHIMFLCYFSFLVLLAMHSTITINLLRISQKITFYFSGIVTGIGIALVYIESQLIFSGVIMSFIAVVVTGIISRKKTTNIFSFYLLVLFATMIITILIIWLGFHSLSGSVLNPRKLFL